MQLHSLSLSGFLLYPRWGRGEHANVTSYHNTIPTYLALNVAWLAQKSYTSLENSSLLLNGEARDCDILTYYYIKSIFGGLGDFVLVG